MWLFCHKYLVDGTLSHYKARLVTNGSTQLEGVDVDETFSLVVKPGTIRTVLSLAASRHWPILQLDVKNAFLHGRLFETVYMHQPLGFKDSTHPDYVDDIVLTASSKGLLQLIIGSLHQEFAMTDLGPLNYFLGISVTRDSSGLFLSQKKYAIEILEKAHTISCNPSRTPVDIESKLGVDGGSVSDLTSLAGSLQYLTFTRPDISYAAGCPTTRRLTSEYYVFLGNNLLSWFAKRQPTLSRSSAEAEYRGVANVVAETCWLRNILRELHTPLSSTTLFYCDNVSVVYLSSNPVQHHRTKHIEIDIHFVHDLVAAGQVCVLHVPSRYQFANIFTKGLPSALFEEFRSSGVVPVGSAVVVLALLRRLCGGVGVTVVWLRLTVVGGDGGILELVLLGHELRYTVPKWCFRDENVKRWEAHFAIDPQPDSGHPKYSLMGFIWAFKTWILETYRVGELNFYRREERHLRALALLNVLVILKGAQPSPRLTPDAVEAQAEWWLASKAFFDGHIRESPTIPPPVNQHSRDDVPEYIYRRMVEQHNLLKEQEDKIKAHNLMINQINEDLQAMRGGRIPGPMKGPVYVGEHCGLSEFSGLQNTQGFTQVGPRMFTMLTNSFFEGVHTLMYPGSFNELMPSRYLTSFPVTPTHMEQQGVSPSPCTYPTKIDPTSQDGRPSHTCDVGGVIPDVMNRERSDSRPMIFFRSPYILFPPTTVLPNKQTKKSRKKTSTTDIFAFDLGKVVGDGNVQDDEVRIIGARATGDFISFENVDPNK
ncbi:ribonuclease H-like domain-containing protein, partial [Tanacetum coccineum]